MTSLSTHTAVIYDAQLIIYRCFKSEVKARDGTKVVIDSPLFTDLTRNLTEFLIEKHKKIKTIRVIFEEADKKLISCVVIERLNDKNLRLQLGLKPDEKVNRMTVLTLNKKLRQKINRLRYQPWFVVDDYYKPNQNLLLAIIKFYKPKKLKHQLSYEDQCLIAYSKESMLPAITNDSHIYDYRIDLEKKKLAHKLIPLKDCTEENLKAAFAR